MCSSNFFFVKFFQNMFGQINIIRKIFFVDKANFIIARVHFQTVVTTLNYRRQIFFSLQPTKINLIIFLRNCFKFFIGCNCRILLNQIKKFFAEENFNLFVVIERIYCARQLLNFRLLILENLILPENVQTK